MFTAKRRIIAVTEINAGKADRFFKAEIDRGIKMDMTLLEFYNCSNKCL